MLKHLAHSHSHPAKLHTFDDFYRSNSKPIRAGFTSSTNDSTINTAQTVSSSSPVSSVCSPSNNAYTFFNVFSDFKSNSTSNALTEEDENEHEEQDKHDSAKSTPLFYLDEDHQNHQEPSPVPSTQQQQNHNGSSNPSPHWPSLILNRFRHQHSTGNFRKQNGNNERHLVSSRTLDNELTDGPRMNKHSPHGFLTRSKTIDYPGHSEEKKSASYHNDDFPELSAPFPNQVKKHRSFVSLLQHFHHPHHPHLSSVTDSKPSSKSNSTGALNTEVNNTNHEFPRNKLVKQRTIGTTNDIIISPVSKPAATALMLPRLASLFHRHHHQPQQQQQQQAFYNGNSTHVSEQYKYRVGNLKARLHHRKTSPSSKVSTKFQCESSNELIDQIKYFEEHEQQFYLNNDLLDIDYLRQQRLFKPVVMKRVHTWHNSFNLKPIDQCLEY